MKELQGLGLRVDLLMSLKLVDAEDADRRSGPEDKTVPAQQLFQLEARMMMQKRQYLTKLMT